MAECSAGLTSNIVHFQKRHPNSKQFPVNILKNLSYSNVIFGSAIRQLVSSSLKLVTAKRHLSQRSSSEKISLIIVDIVAIVLVCELTLLFQVSTAFSLRTTYLWANIWKGGILPRASCLIQFHMTRCHRILNTRFFL